MPPSETVPALYPHPDHPLPDRGSAHFITTDDGFRLRVGLWPAPGEDLVVGAASPEPEEIPVQDAADADKAEIVGPPAGPPAPDNPSADRKPAVGISAEATDPALSEPKAGEAAAGTPDETPKPAQGEPQSKTSASIPGPTDGPGEGPQSGVQGTVIILNGRTEFIEKYGEVIGELLDRRFFVAALDWRGQGGSERVIKGNRLKGHIDDMDAYVEDLTALLAFLETTNCPQPFFCLAHSTGGQVLLRAAPLVQDRIQRAVTTAPFLNLVPARMSVATIYRFVAFFTYAGFGEVFAPTVSRKPPTSEPFEGNPLTSDPARFARNRTLIEAHPNLAIGGPTIAWVYAALTSAQAIQERRHIARISLPILMLSASEDRIVSSRAVERAAGLIRTAAHLSVPGARHEILMERDALRAQFWAAFDAFIPGSA